MQGPQTDVDLAIVGGGMVGASLAVALAGTALRVALIEAADPAASSQPSFDDRTTALGNSSRSILESLGLWARIAPEAAPIRTIHVSDAGRFGVARLVAANQGLEAFGYVVSNRVIGAALREALKLQGNLQLLMPAVAGEIRVDSVGVEIDYAYRADAEQRRRLRARLVIAADGAGSSLRAQLGLGAAVVDYGQTAVIANLGADQPASGTAFERFTESGPIALLPLFDGSYGVVWAMQPALAEQALSWEQPRFLASLQQAFGWRAGRFTRVGRRSAYPLALTRAEAVHAPRALLIGNAAQALHPVAGQGFNLGLRDAAVLAETLAQSMGTDGDIGSEAVLVRFAAARAADRRGVTQFTDSLVRLFGDSRPGVATLRNLGLLAFDLAPPVKAALSRVSWGFAGRASRLARGLSIAD